MSKDNIGEKESMHMYKWYQDFYKATKDSKAYAKYCETVFGKNFSQHGFSDMNQLEKLLEVTQIKDEDIVLDLGCGNGLMAEYISDLTNAHIYGVDYSTEAITQAIARTVDKKDRLTFIEGCIGQKLFPQGLFNITISIDSIFFGNDMVDTLNELKIITKPHGQIAIFYSEFLFDKNESKYKLKSDRTDLAQALQKCNLEYEVWDFTRQHYEYMRLKNQVAQRLKSDFIVEGNYFLYENINEESIDATVSYESFKTFSSRYLYHVRCK